MMTPLTQYRKTDKTDSKTHKQRRNIDRKKTRQIRWDETDNRQEDKDKHMRQHGQQNTWTEEKKQTKNRQEDKDNTQTFSVVHEW